MKRFTAGAKRRGRLNDTVCDCCEVRKQFVPRVLAETIQSAIVWSVKKFGKQIEDLRRKPVFAERSEAKAARIIKKNKKFEIEPCNKNFVYLP